MLIVLKIKNRSVCQADKINFTSMITIKLFCSLLFIMSFVQVKSQTPDQAPYANQSVLKLSRALSKDIMELNGVPFMQPLVEAINSTSNARFINNAHIPTSVEAPYFKVSLNGMFGFVNESMRTYKPSLPSEPFDPLKILDPSVMQIDIKIVDGKQVGSIKYLDTAKLYHYLLKTIIYDAERSGDLTLPKEAATILGRSNQVIEFYKPDGSSALLPATYRRLDSINQILTSFGLPVLSDTLTNGITSVFGQLPGYFTLPPGGDYSSLFAGVPQIEIGSWFGTELLVRFIPPVKMSEEIGKFSFYGIGLKHSISQYFNDPNFDLAVQAVYQVTKLTNSVGVTNAQLEANANIYNFNIQASKKIEDYFDIYGGLSYDNTNINTVFTYFLGKEIQGQVGLLKQIKDDKGNNIDFVKDKDYPGDLEPQTAKIDLKSNAVKFTLGFKKEINDFTFFADYNFSKFNIFSFGVQYLIK